MTPSLPSSPPSSPPALDYARLPRSAIDAVVLGVQPDGALLRVAQPWWLPELAKSLIYLVGVLALSVVVVLATTDVRRYGFSRADPGEYVCVSLSILAWAVFAFEWVKSVRMFWRIVTGDPRVGTRFFPAADQPPSRKVDAVRSVELRREPMQATLTRPHYLRIRTQRRKEFRLLRGRPVDELEAVAEELRSLLRLDAAPSKGFPVVVQVPSGDEG